MKKPILQILRITGFLALGILLLYFAFRGIALDELASTLREANFWWIGLSMFFAVLSLFSRARRWVLLIEPLGFKPSFKNTYHSLMVGYLSNFALPRLGEVTRCVTLGNREKIPVDSLIGTVIIERVTDLVMLLMIMVVLIISWAEKFGTFFNESIFIPMQEKISGTFGGMILFWVLVIGAISVVLLLLYLFRKPLGRIRLYVKLQIFSWGYWMA